MRILVGCPMRTTPSSGGIAPTVLVAGVINLAFWFPTHQIGRRIGSKAILGTSAGAVEVILRTGIVIDYIGITDRYIQWVVERDGFILCDRKVRQRSHENDSNYSIKIHWLVISLFVKFL